ncbi:MAG: hypothetical protein AB7F98_18365 [Novosphingobium sp.]
MGWFRKIFGGGDRRDEAELILGKLNDLLNIDEAQNAALPEELKATLFVGGGVDSIAGATGEFGRSVSNPIPVNGPIGEVTYLSALTTSDGRDVWAHRLGSIDRVDIFEIVSDDGADWWLLYLTPYHTRKSRLVPKGFRFRKSPRVRGVLATNQHVPNFPVGLHEAIRHWCKATLGFPLVGQGLRDAVQVESFRKPAHHVSEIEALGLESSTTDGDDIQATIFRAWTQNKLLNPIISVLQDNIGCDDIDVSELLMFCASVVTYCYLLFGPKQPNHVVLDQFHRQIVDDITTGRRNFESSLATYQTRYQEYVALINPVLDAGENKGHHMTTLLMHVCERASHTSAHGKMVKITMTRVCFGLIESGGIPERVIL